MLEVLGIKNAQKLVPLKDGDDMKPRDPVSENMDVINGKPVKAFIYQDHEAHITVHTTAMQDPKIMQLLGQNPNAQSMMSAMQAHIAEHLAFEYRKQVEAQAGVPLPPQDAEMDKDTEIAVSRLAAQAASQLLQNNQAEAQQQQNQQMAEDPIIKMQQEELEIKKGELELKKQKMQLDAAEKNDRLELEQMRIESQEEIAGLNIGAKLAMSKSDLDAKQEAEGLRTGIEIAREALQSEQSAPNQKQPKE
jgi:post-segregation antitoxin (ccd killing protein)